MTQQGTKNNTNNTNSTDTTNTTDTELKITDINLDTDTNSELLHKIFHRIEELETTVNNLQTENELLKSKIATLEKQTDVLQSRADHINDSIESTEIKLNNSIDDVSQEQKQLEQRLKQLEAENGITDWEDAKQNASCELERFQQMDESLRSAELSQNVIRAITLWDYFEQWSKPVSHGQLLKSNEIRKLLTTRLNTKFEWTQIYRVMEAFNRNTPDNYQIINTESTGKSIIRYYEDSPQYNNP